MIDLAKLARPWTPTDADRPLDPVQKPSRIDDVIGRVSIAATETTELLRYWDPRHETLDVPALLTALGIPTASYSIALSPICATPIESAYLECMKLEPANDGISAADAIDAFVQLQVGRYPDMERYLVERYGDLTPERERDLRFRVIDYPVRSDPRRDPAMSRLGICSSSTRAIATQ